MRTRHLAVLLLLCFSGGWAIPVRAQSAAPEGRSEAGETRRVVRKTVPMYPQIAKQMNLSGTVRLLATVAPDGTVKTVQPMGGSLVLIQAAQDAVSKWKFATASSESKEPVEIHFNPQ